MFCEISVGEKPEVKALPKPLVDGFCKETSSLTPCIIVDEPKLFDSRFFVQNKVDKVGPLE